MYGVPYDLAKMGDLWFGSYGYSAIVHRLFRDLFSLEAGLRQKPIGKYRSSRFPPRDANHVFPKGREPYIRSKKLSNDSGVIVITFSIRDEDFALLVDDAGNPKIFHRELRQKMKAWRELTDAELAAGEIREKIKEFSEKYSSCAGMLLYPVSNPR